MKNIILFIIVAVILLMAGAWVNRQWEVGVSKEAAIKAEKEKEAEAQTMEGFKKEDTVLGTGAETKVGDTIVVNYRGRLASTGVEFDSSYKTGNPLTLTLGSGQVIKGWELGLVGMKVGGKRKLTIPPALGYGSSGFGDLIPPNSTLIFDVELIEVR